MLYNFGEKNSSQVQVKSILVWSLDIYLILALRERK